MKNQQNLGQKLAINFKNQSLIKQALIHRSSLNELPFAKKKKDQRRLASNERLEFLGDAILSFITSEWLFKKFPSFSEGELTNLRANLVKTGSLAKISKKLGVGEFLILGKGEEKSGGRQNPSLLANTLEAIIGAIFLDQGLGLTKKFIKENFTTLLEKLIERGEFKDFKSLLQEKLQAQTGHLPVYKLISQKGPDHARIFTIAVYNQSRLMAQARGRSKRKAEEGAARLALEKLSVGK